MNLSHQQSGRTITEIIGILAIMGILSFGAMTWYLSATRKNHANELLYKMNMRIIEITAALQRNPIVDIGKMNDFLGQYNFTLGNHQVIFHTPTDESDYQGRTFVADLTDRDGKRIKGTECHHLMELMLKQTTTADMDITLQDEVMPDGTTSNLAIRLNNRTISINGICGND